MRGGVARPLTGLATIGALVAIAGIAVTSFRGGFTASETVTVLSPRAGLVMNPGAKVQFHGVQVGKVQSVEERPDGQAAILMAMDPARLQTIPVNAIVDVASATVFGAKSVQLMLPPDPSGDSMYDGQTLDAQHVMVEVNTVFQQLVSVLSRIEPEKLNETLGAIASATAGDGERTGRMLTDLNSFLGQVNPKLESIGQDLAAAPAVIASYADAAPDLMSVARNATRISQTVTDQQQNLDSILLSATGLADVGTDVLTTNRRPLTNMLKYLVPTTDLTNQYNEALRCALGGVARMATNPPLAVPGVEILAGFMWGQERYRYPENIPKVAAKGGPQCTDLPVVPFDTVPPFVVTDVGANPWKRTAPGIVLNSDGLKQLLFGPIDGPPRNSAQIGQPG